MENICGPSVELEGEADFVGDVSKDKQIVF